MIRVLLVESEQLTRSALRALLCESPSFCVVSDVARARGAIEAAARFPADVGIFSGSERESAWLAEIAELRAGLPELPLLVISRNVERRIVARVTDRGVLGYLLRDSTPRDLEHAVQQVAQGMVFVDPRLPRARRTRMNGSAPAPVRLTPRQREVLQLVVAGKSSKEIATSLGLSPKTVETYRTQLMQRLGVHDVASLVRRAVQEELVLRRSWAQT